MATKADFYEFLGVDRSATQDQIRQAYRKLAREYHPDLNKAPDAESKFKAVQEAYDVLKDEQKAGNLRPVRPRGTAVGFQPCCGRNQFRRPGRRFRIILRRRHAPRRSWTASWQDLQTAVSLGFMEAVDGVTREIEISRLELCDVCDGSGQGPESEVATCSVCKGSGEVRRAQSSIFGQFVNVATCENCGGGGRVVLNLARTAEVTGANACDARLRSTFQQA